MTLLIAPRSSKPSEDEFLTSSNSGSPSLKLLFNLKKLETDRFDQVLEIVWQHETNHLLEVAKTANSLRSLDFELIPIEDKT